MPELFRLKQGWLPRPRMQRALTRGGPGRLLIAFLLGQRYFVAGITSSAVKE